MAHKPNCPQPWNFVTAQQYLRWETVRERFLIAGMVPESPDRLLFARELCNILALLLITYYLLLIITYWHEHFVEALFSLKTEQARDYFYFFAIIVPMMSRHHVGGWKPSNSVWNCSNATWEVAKVNLKNRKSDEKSANNHEKVQYFTNKILKFLRLLGFATSIHMLFWRFLWPLADRYHKTFRQIDMSVR